MKQLLLLLAICSTATVVHAQGWLPSGARSMSMSNASVSLYDVWSYHNNPGALAKVDRLSAGLSYENRFLLRELQSQGLSIAIPMKVGVLSVGGLTYGYTQFRSTKAGLGYSMPLSENFYAGVQLNYQGIQLAQNYGNANTVTAEAGIYAEVTENWSMGFSVFNLSRTRLSEFQDDRLTTVMRLGTAYTFSKKLLVSAEFEKSIEYDVRFKSGLEYQILKDFYFRGGIATAPVEFSFGTGYNFGMIQLDVGTAYDMILGWSPHFSLTYQGKQK
ncbi:MAG: hypothetical protein NXI10_09870 [bacterium]|nr:hypothetical protein [bacterium]